MHPLEKMSWYTLAVVLLALVTFAVIFTLTGNLHGSLGALGLLGLLGFLPSLSKGKENERAWDEFAREVDRRAAGTAYGLFWLYFVFGAVALMLLHWERIPTDRFIAWFLGGVLLFLVVRAVAALIIFRSDISTEMTLMDRLRSMGRLRRSGLLGLGVILFLMTPVWFVQQAVGRGDIPLPAGYAYCGGFLLIYAAMRWALLRNAVGGPDERTARRVAKYGDRTLGIASAGALAGFVVAWALPLEIDMTAWIPQTIYYVLYAGNLSLPLGMVLQGRGGERAEADAGREVENA